jgi:hypothetical protein
VVAFLFLVLLLLAARLRAIPASSLRMLPAHFFLLLLLLAARLRAIPASTLRMLSAHLLLMMLSPHFFLLMLSSHLLLMMLHLLIHGILAVCRASLLASFVMHLGLVSPSVVIVAGKVFSLVFVPVFGIRSFSLPAMFSHLPRLVLTLSCPSFASSANALSALTLARACALAIVFSHIAWLVFALSCSGSPCGPESLGAFALASAFVFVE